MFPLLEDEVSSPYLGAARETSGGSSARGSAGVFSGCLGPALAWF